MDMDGEAEKEPERQTSNDIANEPRTDGAEDGQLGQHSEDKPAAEMLATGDSEPVLEAAASEVEAKVDEAHGAEDDQPAATDAAVDEAAGEMEVDAEAAVQPVDASQAGGAPQARSAPR